MNTEGYLKISGLCFALALFASACGQRHEGGTGDSSLEKSSVSHEGPLPPQYAFIESNLDKITIEEVTNRIGPYTKVGHLTPFSPEIVYEFDLPDHSALLVILERPFDSRNRVHRVRHIVDTNDFHLYP